MLANFGLKIRPFWDSDHENWYSYFSGKWKAFCENDLHQITYLTKSFLGTKNEGNWFSTLAIGWLSLLKPIYRSRAFSVAAPEHWNKLPDDLSSCENLSLFRHKLKIYTLFKIYFRSLSCFLWWTNVVLDGLGRSHTKACGSTLWMAPNFSILEEFFIFFSDCAFSQDSVTRLGNVS